MPYVPLLCCSFNIIYGAVGSGFPVNLQTGAKSRRPNPPSPVLKTIVSVAV